MDVGWVGEYEGFVFFNVKICGEVVRNIDQNQKDEVQKLGMI